jgi:hypothetical protein
MKRCASYVLFCAFAFAASLSSARADVTSVDGGTAVPARFELTMDGKLIADGRSYAKLTIHGVDKFGNDAAPGSPVTVTVATGSLLLREDGADTTHQASERIETKLGDSGRVVLDAYATMTSGEVTINALADGVASGGLSSASFFVAPYAKGALVVGLATAGLGAVPGDVDGSDIFDNGNSNKGRVALYGSGQIADKTVGTFAYETANRLDPTYAFGSYIYDPNERPYLTYGDDGTRSSDALSQAHLYGQIERGRDSLSYGEFAAETGTPSSVGNFQQLVSGVKLHLSNATGTSSLTAFNASNDVQFGRVVFNPLGLADAGPVLRPNLIVGSEIVTLVALDRRTGAIVSQTQLVRNVDYAIDYSSGVLRFINVPLPYDATFDPQVVVVQFQFDGTGTKAQTTGGSGRLTLGTTALEAGYANDANGVANSVVASQSIHGTLGAGTWQISHASTSGGDPALSSGAPLTPTSGDNTHVAADVPIGPNHISAVYDNTTIGFDNVFGAFATPGLAEMRVDWERKFGNGTLTTGYDRESDAATGHYQQEYGVRYHAKPVSRVTYVAALQVVNASAFSQADALPAYPAPIALGLPAAGANATVPGGTTLQAELGASWQVTNRLSLSADRSFDLGSAVAAVPTQTSAELAYAFPKGKVYVRQLWSDGPNYTVPESTADFSALSQATRATVVGVSRDISPMTTIGTAYVVEQTNDGTDAYATYGVKQRFILNPQLHGDAFLENGGGLGTGLGLNSSIAGADQTGFTVWGTDLDYDHSGRVRAALQFQDRTGFDSGTVLDIGASGRISSEFALSANVNSSRLADYSADDSRIGLAWRPSGTNRVAALLSFEDLSGQYTTALSDSTQVVTYDQLYRPTAQLELAGRLAYQLDGDAYYAAHTALFGLRAQQRIGPKADVAAEWQTLSTPAIADLAQTAFALEFGYRLGSSLRVASGYNFSGTPDPSLTGRPIRRGMYVTATSTIDRIFGWGRTDGKPIP